MTSKKEPRPRGRSKPAPPVTRGDGLADRLLDEITSGVLPPGSRLDEVTLAARYGTSRTPVREALRQLEATGLVERRPYKGAVVSTPSEAHLAEMFVAAAEVEAICARLAVTAMEPAERLALRRTHDKMADLARAGDANAYAKVDSTFHETICAGAHNTILAKMAHDLRRRLAPLRKRQFEERLDESSAEHEEIVRALERGHAEQVAAAMRTTMRPPDAAPAAPPADDR